MENVIRVRVKPSSPEFRVTKKDGYFLVEVTSRPEGNKANLEIIKELSKHFGRQVRILKGFKSREKMVAME